MGLPPAPAIPLDKVEWRVDSKPFDGDRGTRCRYVPYFDARDAMSLLDEWVGSDGWQDSYRETSIDGKPAVFCVLRVRVDAEWVSKSDVGVPSSMEPQLGSVSHAFKRACVKWGVGRNVYALPTLWAPCDTYAQGQKAKPNEQTLPDILRQLKAKGFDASGGRVEEDATQQGTGVDGAVSDGDAGQTGDGADSHDVGRSVPEPAPDLCPGCSQNAKDGKVLKPARVDGALWHKECWDGRPM